MAKKPKGETALTIQDANDADMRRIDVQPPEPSTLVLIQMALDKGVDPDRLGKLFDLHERDQKNKAARAYAEAMNLAQAAMPTIACDAHNTHTKSNYVRVETILKAIKPVYTEHGFSLSFGQGDTKPEWCRTTCDVRHVAGHVEHFNLDLPLDGVGAKGGSVMTAVHGALSSDTYAMGRLLKKIFNLTILDETDDDGNGSGAVNDEQAKEIEKLIVDIREFIPLDVAKFCLWLGVKTPDVTQIRAKDFEKARDELKRRLATGPKIKAQVDQWQDWFAGKPSLDDCNKILVKQFETMETGTAKLLLWNFCKAQAEAIGYEYVDNKFQARAKK